MSSSTESETAEQESIPLKPIPWGWYLGVMTVIIGACITLVGGGREVVSVVAIPIAVLLLGALVALADHSRQLIHGTGAESDRARSLSNMVQPLLAKFLFLTSTVIILSSLGSAFGLGAPVGWFWGMLALLGGLTLIGFRQYCAIIKEIDITYPRGGTDRVLKLGIFYFNPDDDDIIINSGGINIPNFGNKYFWVLAAVLLGFTIFITALASLAG